MVDKGEELSLGVPKDEEVAAGGETVKRAYQPPVWKIHLSLILAQVIFGGGAVVGKLGIDKFNPILFAFIREGSAGPILCVCAYLKDRVLPDPKHIWWFLWTGLFIFSNQLCFIVGIKLSNPVVGSAWQPSQAVMVTAIAIGIGRERATLFKILGILLAFGGACFIVFYGAKMQAGSAELAGNILYFFNCLGTALYIICAQPIMKTYPAMSVTGWSYIVASLMMMVACLVGNSVHPIYDFICDDCPPGSKWHVPMNAVFALLYWILLTSVGAYLLMTWGSKYADASLVLSYSPLQPATSAIMSAILIAAGFKGKLEEPGLNILGVIGIFIGLGFVVYDNRKAQQAKGAEYLEVHSETAGESKENGSLNNVVGETKYGNPEIDGNEE
eukprot:CAMPEP_0184480942 /NCGR_PEP_ID=MMETSP0113_2-20130426/2477_1 /TAXON_ID=91329 /ORGANISM="Norrisiella sphaerica, Strain BC52" /LENGTH=385 /DNA_ID=CAMNT_0026859765 /DNA_START=139 /DNA_END=1296 /DNA_ORIENTATION=+